MAADGVVPDVRDGLTPLCRHALRALAPEFRPGTRVVDDALRAAGRDSRRRAIHGELVRMARDWELRHPLVAARGNLGSINGDGAASAEYIELRLAAAGADTLAGRLPNLLVNGSFALATGAASQIPPHNLREVAAAAIAFIEDPEIGVEGLLRHVAGPDFPTGAIVDVEGLREAYARGRGEVTVTARTHVEERPGGREALVVTELPFGVDSGGRGGVIGEIVRGTGSGRIAGVADIDDRSDAREGLRIVLELEGGVAPEQVCTQLFEHTRLRTRLPLRFVVAADGSERTLSLRDLIERWVRDRREALARDGTTRSRADIEQLVRDELLEIAERHGDARRTALR